jgi:hypothetical protein
MRVRYVGPIEELEVSPAGSPPFQVKRGEWVDVDPAVAGKRPGGPPPSHDLGEGLLALGDWVDGEFEPLWETEAAQKAAATRAANETNEKE